MVPLWVPQAMINLGHGLCIYPTRPRGRGPSTGHEGGLPRAMTGGDRKTSGEKMPIVGRQGLVGAGPGGDEVGSKEPARAKCWTGPVQGQTYTW